MDLINWKTNDQYLIGLYKLNKINLNLSSKVAAFDLDDTIIKPKDNKKFSETSNDWEFVYKICDKLIYYHTNKYNLVIISNQLSIKKGYITQEIWCKKIENVLKIIDLPMIVLASINNDVYRKPRTGLWDDFIICNLNKSFYCGDAGGLEKRSVKLLEKKKLQIKKDHSDTDAKFAKNIGIKFIHRDEMVYCVNYEKNFNINYGVNFKNIKVGKYDDFIPSKDEMIINVGYPGSGKTFYTKNYIIPKGYKHINQDTLKTFDKCLKKCEEYLVAGYNVVIDNTNMELEKRKKYIDLAKKYSFKCRCINFKTDLDTSYHNNLFRSFTSDTKSIPKIVYYKMRKMYVEPSIKEGYSNVENLEFVLDNNLLNIDDYSKYLE